MKIIVLHALVVGCALTCYSQRVAIISEQRNYTVIISYCACTDGGDYSVDSGAVIIPAQLRQSYIDERCKRAKLYGASRETIASQLASNGYQTWALRATSVAAWDSLFTPPKRASDSKLSESKARAIQGSYWRRRYRVTGTVAGINGPYLVFKVLKAVRVKDVKY